MALNNDLPLLKQISSPRDLKNLSAIECKELAQEIRDCIVSTVSKTGGHLSSNLGIVELTIALHLSFDFSYDRLVFDVGHQSYVHKLLTGRAERFDTLRQKGGISGFPKTTESCYDAFNTGHSSTAVSAALGMLRAFRLQGDTTRHVVAVLGDGALTGGLAYEALDDAGEQEIPLIVVLNDNDMSISGNVGGMSSHLSKLRTSKPYKRLKHNLSSRLKKIPLIGETVSNSLERLKNRIKYFVLPNVMFEELGFTYVGPIDGHNIEGMVSIFEHAKNIKDKPILVHVITKKGKGYEPAEKNPEKFHGIGKFDEATGSSVSSDSNSKEFAECLCELAEKDDRIVAITAAMESGTGLKRFHEKFPTRFFDVGIAEQHGVTMAAGMAEVGLKPVFCVYSTFLQRGYDQLLHDVCLQKLPVVFGIDRAGLVGADGETHQGVYDIAYINTLPDCFTLFSPSSIEELRSMLRHAIVMDGPVGIRYSRGLLPSRAISSSQMMDEWEIICPVQPVTIVSTGRLTQRAIDVVISLQKKDIEIGLINARIICPVKKSNVDILKGIDTVITIEDGILDTGFGAQVARLLSAEHTSVINLGVPNTPIEAGTLDEQDAVCGLTSAAITETVLNAFRQSKKESMDRR